MGAAPNLEKARQITMTLSAEILDQVSAKARALRLSFDETVTALLRLGLKAQERREHDLDLLVDRLHSTGDPETKQRLGNELGSMIFGK